MRRVLVKRANNVSGDFHFEGTKICLKEGKGRGQPFNIDILVMLSMLFCNLRSLLRLRRISLASRHVPDRVPVLNCSLIQSSLIVVSPWIMAASRPFLQSPLRALFNSSASIAKCSNPALISARARFSHRPLLVFEETFPNPRHPEKSVPGGRHAPSHGKTLLHIQFEPASA